MLRRISPIHQRGKVSQEQEELMQSLREAQRSLDHAYLAFDDITDSDLMESCIFEIRSLPHQLSAAADEAAGGEPDGAERGERGETAMGLTEKVAIGILILFVVGAVLRLFKTPLKLAMQVLLNTLLGFGTLFLLNLTEAVTGISLGVNLLNALVIGILGVPGLGLLLLVQWLFT